MHDQSCSSFPSFFAGSVPFVSLTPPGKDIPDLLPPDTSGWELIFIDCDTTCINSENHSFTLFRNELFIRENSLNAPQTPAAENGAIILRFSCSSPFLSLLTYLPLYTSKTERLIFAQLLVRTASEPTSCAGQYMEAFLDRLLARRYLYIPPDVPSSWTQCMNDNTLFPLCRTTERPLLPPLHSAELLYLSVLQYLKRRLCTSLTVDKICVDNLTSRSCLESLFHSMGWHGVMDCFSRLKINAAKRLIASGDMSITQIAATLNYSSVHYFSRRFKEITKMTPSDYAAFLKTHSGDIMFL